MFRLTQHRILMILALFGVLLLSNCYTVVAPPYQHRTAVPEEAYYEEEEYRGEYEESVGGYDVYNHYYYDPYYSVDPFLYNFHYYSPFDYNWYGYPSSRMMWGYSPYRMYNYYDPYGYYWYRPWYGYYGGFYTYYYDRWYDYGGSYYQGSPYRKRDFTRRSTVTRGDLAATSPTTGGRSLTGAAISTTGITKTSDASGRVVNRATDRNSGRAVTATNRATSTQVLKGSTPPSSGSRSTANRTVNRGTVSRGTTSRATPPRTTGTTGSRTVTRSTPPRTTGSRTTGKTSRTTTRTVKKKTGKGGGGEALRYIDLSSFNLPRTALPERYQTIMPRVNEMIARIPNRITTNQNSGDRYAGTSAWGLRSGSSASRNISGSGYSGGSYTGRSYSSGSVSRSGGGSHSISRSSGASRSVGRSSGGGRVKK